MAYEEEDYFEEPLPEAATKTLPNGGVNVTIDASALSAMSAAIGSELMSRAAKRIDDAITKTINKALDDTIHAKIEEVIGRITLAHVETVLLQPRQRTNSWGQPEGGTPITLVDQIPTMVASYLGETVNEKGERRGGYDNAGTPRLAWLTGKSVRDAIDRETKLAVDKVTEQARAVVRERVGQFVAEQMVPAIEARKI